MMMMMMMMVTLMMRITVKAARERSDRAHRAAITRSRSASVTRAYRTAE